MSESQDFAGFTGADLTDWRTSSSDMKDDGGLYDDILTGSLKEIPPKPLYVDQPHSSMTIAGPQASLKRKFSCSNEFSFPPMQQGYHSPILCYPMVETSVKVHRTIDEIRDRLNGATPFSQPFLIGEVSSGRHVLVASIPGVTGWQAEITNDNDHSTEIQSVIFLMECAADDKTLINTSGLTDAEKKTVEIFARHMPGGHFVDKDLNDETTYLVVPTTKLDDKYLCANLTTKYLKALTLRIPIISFDWVLKCFENQIPLAPDHFQVIGDIFTGPVSRSVLKRK